MASFTANDDEEEYDDENNDGNDNVDDGSPMNFENGVI